MLLFDLYYKQYGILRPQQVMKPRLFEYSALSLPKQSLVHYFPTENVALGPDPFWGPFKLAQKRIPTQHIIELADPSPWSRRISNDIQQKIRSFHRTHSNFKLVNSIRDLPPDSLIPNIINYGFLAKVYRYIETPLTPYAIWLDRWKTLIATLKSLENTEYNHFIAIDVPDKLPGIQSLRRFEEVFNVTGLKIIPEPQQWIILELWRWFSDNEKVTSSLKTLNVKQLDKINLILFYNTKWSVLNLGRFHNWLKQPESTSPIQFSHFQLQKLLLNYFIKIQDSKPTEDTSVVTKLTDTEVVIPNVPLSENDDVAEYDNFNNITDDDFSAIYDTVDQNVEALDNLEQAKYKLVSQEPGDEDIVINEADIDPEDALKTTTSAERLKDSIYQDSGVEAAVHELLDVYTDRSSMSASEYRTLLKQLDILPALKSPYNPSETLIKNSIVDPALLKVSPEPFANLKHVPDASMSKSTVNDFDKHYVRNVMSKDIEAAVCHIQRAGVIVQDYQIQRDESVLGQYEVHSVRLKPIDGQPSTIHFKLPIVDEFGEYSSNGKIYHQRKQRVDLPIRKINSFTVALTSYYGKLFVIRSNKKANDSDFWLSKQILTLGLSGESPYVTKVTPGDVFDNTFKAPKVYSGMSQHLSELEVRGYLLNFDHKKRYELFSNELIQSLETDGSIVVGRSVKNDPIIVSKNNLFYILENHQLTPLGTLAQLANLDTSKMPLDYTVLKVFNKEIPLITLLGYYLGLNHVLALLNVKPKIITDNKRVKLQSNEWSVKFKDCQLVFTTDNVEANLILAGLREYKLSLSQYPLATFNDPDIYLNLLESKSISVRYLREFDNLNQLFIDPITRGLLEELKEPVTFKGLLLRSNELLTTLDHPDIQDLNAMRIRGYERFAGIVYQQLSSSIRNYKSKNIRGRSKIELSPYAIWREINDDPSNVLVSDINPIENLKQQEGVTYIGVGGRSKESMNKATRLYHEQDLGIISEATIDSGDVGINSFLSSNPAFKSLRGLIDISDISTKSGGNLLSSAANLNIGSVMEDPKRTNFTSIQHSHTVPLRSYTQPVIRTGYEEVIGYRVKPIFASLAEFDGKVIKRSPQGIVVEYSNGQRKGFPLGKIYGRAEETTYPHELVTNLQDNDEFMAGDAISFNINFFEPDQLNPRKIIWKSTLTVKTALCESSTTHEDSCGISPALSQLLTVETTKVRSFVVSFKQGIKQVLPVGTAVKPEDVVFVIEDEVTNASDLFDEETLMTLQRLSNMAPKAKVKGVIDRYEVYYHGNKDDMSVSLRQLVELSDKGIQQRLKAQGLTTFNGAVNSEYNVEGNPLMLDTAEIKIYIGVKNSGGVGDKTVFANQMKSVIGEVFDNDYSTEDGVKVDAIFGFKSIYNRIVISPFVIGTTNTLLNVIAKKAVAMFRS